MHTRRRAGRDTYHGGGQNNSVSHDKEAPFLKLPNLFWQRESPLSMASIQVDVLNRIPALFEMLGRGRALAGAQEDENRR
jgi:hypothetical protein